MGVKVHRLTWSGYEFLDNARNHKVWKIVMRQLGDKTVTASMTVLNTLLIEATKKLLT